MPETPITFPLLEELDLQIRAADALIESEGNTQRAVHGQQTAKDAFYAHRHNMMAAAGNYLSLHKDDVEKLGRDSNYAAVYDYKNMPDFVRAFLGINSLNAVSTGAIRDAGLMPKLYARHNGTPVRVVMVSRLGDVGISLTDKEFGYYKRVSIYDLTDFAKEMHT